MFTSLKTSGSLSNTQVKPPTVQNYQKPKSSNKKIAKKTRCSQFEIQVKPPNVQNCQKPKSSKKKIVMTKKIAKKTTCSQFETQVKPPNVQNCQKPKSSKKQIFITKNCRKPKSSKKKILITKQKKQLSYCEDTYTTEKKQYLSIITDLKNNNARLERENQKLNHVLKITEKSLPPNETLTRCTACKTSKIVEDMKRSFASELKDKDRKLVQQKIELERKFLREQKEREKKFNEKKEKRELEIAGMEKRYAKKLETSNRLRQADQVKLLKCQEKMSSLTQRSNIIQQVDTEMKKKKKKIYRTSQGKIKND